jgi:hypothetical protein
LWPTGLQPAGCRFTDTGQIEPLKRHTGQAHAVVGRGVTQPAGKGRHAAHGLAREQRLGGGDVEFAQDEVACKVQTQARHAQVDV